MTATATATATNIQNTLTNRNFNTAAANGKVASTKTPVTTSMGPIDAANALTASSRNVRFAFRKKRTFAKIVINDNHTEDENDGITPARGVKLSSYNSDFLSGLFADVAKANVLKEFEIERPQPQPHLQPSQSLSSSETSSVMESSSSRSLSDYARPQCSSHIISDSSDSPRPLKKSRTNLLRSSSLRRSRATCTNLLSKHYQQHQIQQQQQQRQVKQEASQNNLYFDTDMIANDETYDATVEAEVEMNVDNKQNQDSLAFQLDCLDTQTRAAAMPTPGTVSPSTSNHSKNVSKDLAVIAFPNLPSAVSDSSCESNGTGINRAGATVRHGQITQTSAPVSLSTSTRDGSGGKDSFGWFVDLDDQEPNLTAAATVSSSAGGADAESPQDLAFQAPTAPKRSTNYVEEVEQAYAEDTIDSVLGDLPF